MIYDRGKSFLNQVKSFLFKFFFLIQTNHLKFVKINLFRLRNTKLMQLNEIIIKL